MSLSDAGRRARLFSASLLLTLSAAVVHAHGDVTPHPVDTHALTQLGSEWLDADPYRGNEKAIEIGAEGYKHNCAACHGLNAVSGGMAPDLLRLTSDCAGMSADSKASCLNDSDEYFRDVVLNGKKNSEGRVTMPGYETVFTQEAVWAIKAYLDKRTEEVN
ncbi:cytochrome c-550 PedF [Nitrogeniibacter aestuarii]|uniref:cytochrome c-550 PedF n=1 Tax=Nitrogeniibacter aestuarii TaxID=2815343 RepID=UPI001D12857F|nr:cytochrome c-550 PedF [Nitrogeniibacter aestuarii]